MFIFQVIISHPAVLIKVSEIIFKYTIELNFSTLCGVPYTALPIATCISTSHAIPMLIRRKEAKDYGTKKMLEGKYEKGCNLFVIDFNNINLLLFLIDCCFVKSCFGCTYNMCDKLNLIFCSYAIPKWLTPVIWCC